MTDMQSRRTAAADRAQRYLMELTNLPTASGREDRVIAWIKRWAKGRKQVQLRADRFGNLTLKRVGAASRTPIIIEAHLDHPAFVVRAVTGEREVEADFRGGVYEQYFLNTSVALHHDDLPAQVGTVTQMLEARPSAPEIAGIDKVVRITFDEPITAAVGDVVRWNLPASHIADGLLRAPACDDLAGVAAAISAFEQLLRGKAGDVRLLFTRAEEVGLIGAIAACHAKQVPKGARIIALETSRSYAESPIGGGPILRVGDRTSTFDPDLTYRLGKLAERIAAGDDNFLWQRKLMPGGTCEASAFQALGFTCTCLCLALGNYHNMNEPADRIDSEIISIDDYHGLVRWLVEIGRSLDDPKLAPPLAARLNELYEQRKWVLAER